MCGRYTLHHSTEEIAQRFNVQNALFRATPRFNAAPTQILPVVRQIDDARTLEGLKWGLVPSWAKDADFGAKMMNARAETLTDKPAFRTSLKRRRCLVPSDGFYEWNAGENRQPYHIRRRDGELFAYAGLWDEWHDPNLPRDVEPLRTYSIVTCAPNALMSGLHHRMAVVLRPEDESLWLDPNVQDVPSLLDCLLPYEYDDFEAYRINRRVGRVDTDDETLILPMSAEDAATPPGSSPIKREESGSLFD